jgi:hypothetical protein
MCHEPRKITKIGIFGMSFRRVILKSNVVVDTKTSLSRCWLESCANILGMETWRSAARSC